MMSTSKRKSSSNCAELYDNIRNVLTTIKPKLNDRTRSAWSTIRAELHHLASLAETFTMRRSKSGKDWMQYADDLDREGVDLWNVSAMMREGGESGDGRAVAAALRLAGFRLIEAGLEQKPSIETLVHILQLASKAGASLSATASHDLAASVLGSAAQYEEALRKAEDPDRSQAQARTRAVVVYYSSRMEAAWKEGNDGIALFMLQKIMENDYLALLLPRDRESLATQLLEIGKSLLRAGSQENDIAARGVRVRDAVKWLRNAFAAVEHLEEVNQSSGKDLKRSILRSLARAYFLSSSEDDPENLVRAEAVLNELTKFIDVSEPTRSEYQQLRWMRIAVLKKRRAGQPMLLDAFQSIIDHMALTESNITDVLQELRSFGQEHVLVTTVLQRCIQRILNQIGDDKALHGHIDKLLLSLIFHCSKDADHTRATQDLAASFTDFTQAEFQLSRVSATACLTLLWQFGDRQYQAGHWSAAADWFFAGTHQAFGAIANLSTPKCCRKAALCYIQQNEYARAAAVIQRCSGNEAATYYVSLLIAVHQGLEDEAIYAVKTMVAAPDFNRKMLMLATRLANESDMKALLLSILEALFDTVNTRAGLDLNVEAITLIRCIIRLVLQLMAEPGSNKGQFVPVLIGHFRTARTLIAKLNSRTDAPMVTRDISWLWRTAYNCAVQGCSEWESSEENVSDLFDIARQLLEAYQDSILTDVDVEIPIHIMETSFAAVAGRIFAVRSHLISEQHGQDERLQTLAEDLTSCKKRIRAVIDKTKLLDGEDISRAESFIQVLHVFQTEVLCQLKEWEQLLNTVKEAMQADALAVNYFEAITDILWVEKDCPTQVLFTALEAILHASLDRNSLSINKFSRWLRAICTMLLSRNTASDRAKAIGYVEQAVHVLEDHAVETESEEAYPTDERQWLLGTSYNTGVECLHASLLDEAKRWFEACSTICRFVPKGSERAEKISETYSQLLERYAS